MSFTSLLKQRCSIQRRQSGAGRGAWGQDTDAFTTIAANVPCRTYAWNGGEITAAAGVAVTVDTVFDLAAGTDITTRDRLVLNGRTYNVVAVNEVGGGHHLTVKARQQ